MDDIPKYIKIVGDIPSIIDEHWNYPSISCVDIPVEIKFNLDNVPDDICFALVPYDNQKAQEQKPIRRRRRRIR